MKKLVALAALLLVGAVLTAGTPSGWLDDFAKAQKLAKKEKRPMLVLFTGSDWCGWCKKLRGDVLSKPEFEKFAASKKLVLVYIDFPRESNMTEAEKERNKQLASTYKVRGFPTTIVFDANGKELGRMPGYSKQYIKNVTKMLKK